MQSACADRRTWAAPRGDASSVGLDVLLPVRWQDVVDGARASASMPTTPVAAERTRPARSCWRRAAARGPSRCRSPAARSRGRPSHTGGWPVEARVRDQHARRARSSHRTSASPSPCIASTPQARGTIGGVMISSSAITTVDSLEPPRIMPMNMPNIMTCLRSRMPACARSLATSWTPCPPSPVMTIARSTARRLALRLRRGSTTSPGDSPGDSSGGRDDGGALDGAGNPHGEHRAAARRALDRDAAAELLDEAAHDVEAEARRRRSGASPSRRPGGTSRRSPPGPRGRMPMPVSRDAEHDAAVPSTQASTPHAAALGELERVADQVPHDDGELPRIGGERDAGDRASPVERDPARRAAAPAQPAPSSRPERRQRDRLERGRRRVPPRCGRSRACSRSDSSRSRPAASMRAQALGAVAVVERPVARHLGVAEDHVERRAQLVRHRRHELAT